MVGVAFITAALVIVLSVFNGLEDLLRTLNNSFDPQIKIQAVKGKSFEVTPELLNKIKSLKGVEIVTEVIEDYAYVRYRDANQVVTIKGVSDNFIEQKRIPQENIVEGDLKLRENGVNYAILGIGVRYTLSVAVSDAMFPLQIYYIKNSKASAGVDPSKLYAHQNILPGGVFSIVQNFDENYVIVPLQFAVDLLNYGNRRTSLELKLKKNVNEKRAEERIQAAVGDDLMVLNHEEQHKDLYKLLKMEKLFAFLALTLLLIIGSINIFFSLMMLALDKKKDISILSSVGATPQLVRNIFLAEGSLIAFCGAILGLIFGGAFCWLQMNYGIISMGMETSVTQGYPIKVRAIDFVATLFVVSVITFCISIRPAILASRLVHKKELLGKQ
ncbi:FtsX-like permease family protein [Fulvivirgaceae bacterium PWU20]|uniref:FtsX-like permease family protein n=2 Tax=Chryseosolibacter indicus TaxID=2782351 RepID=A0ABS5VW40_9BACT|nr:FtsX-like permease family protein [Chryseosolibacter indicus]